MKRLFTFFLGLLLFFSPLSVQAGEIDSSLPEVEITQKVEIVEEPKPMTQEEIDELLGEDPYLGQTSWLGGKIAKTGQ
tara:strand:+ start:94 stop:327 length:234 start_codon:yes stop_codon:yes gene_type:complete